MLPYRFNLILTVAMLGEQGSVKDNAIAVRDIVLAQYEQFGKQVVLLGHSKGGTDAAAMCAMFWGELKDKVRGLVMLQAVYGGTPLAEDLLGGGQFGALNSLFLGKVASFSNPDVSTTFTLVSSELLWDLLHSSFFTCDCASCHLVYRMPIGV